MADVPKTLSTSNATRSDRPGEAAGSAALADAARLTWLDPRRVRFLRHGGVLRLTKDGDRSYLSVTVLRAFPLSAPDGWLSVRDGGGQEIGLIADPSALADDDRALVTTELARRYFLPVVRRIVAARERFGTVDWTIETDRGRTMITTRNLREQVQRPAPGRLVLTDVDGNRYDIPSVDALDAGSAGLLFRHL